MKWTDEHNSIRETAAKFVDNEIENSDRSSILSNSNILLKIDIDTIKSSIKSKNDLHDLISNKLKIEI